MSQLNLKLVKEGKEAISFWLIMTRLLSYAA